MRTHGSTEECRLRATMLCLSGSSIMFSDDLTQLPEERIRLMQTCLPAMERAARPLNLFASECPDVWHLPLETEGAAWDLVALFNFGDELRTVPLCWGQLGLPPNERRPVREFHPIRIARRDGGNPGSALLRGGAGLAGGVH